MGEPAVRPLESAPGLRLIQGSTEYGEVLDLTKHTEPITRPIRRWPDLNIDIPEHRIYGTSTLPPNPPDQRRGIIGAILTAGNALPPEFSEELPTSTRDAMRSFETAWHAFFVKRVTVQKMNLPLADFVDPYGLVDELTPQLTEENHPLVQAINDLRTKNTFWEDHNSRQQYNRSLGIAAVNSQELVVLSDARMKELNLDLHLAFRGSHLLEIAKLRKSGLQREARTKK